MDSSAKPEQAESGGIAVATRHAARKHVARPDCGVPRSVLQGLLSSSAEIGAAPAEILRQAGATPAAHALLARDARLVDVALFVRASCICHEYLRAHIEGPERGSCLTSGQLTLLSKCLIGCSDLGEAIRTTSQFFEMLTGRIGRVALKSQGAEAALCVSTVVSRSSRAAQALDLCNIVLIHKLYEWLTDACIPLKSAEFNYPCPPRPDLHLSLLSCPARFGLPETCLTFPASSLSLPVIRRRAELNALLEGFPFTLIAGDRQHTSLAEHTYRAMIDAHMRLRKVPSVDEVARLFGITGWTLRRRLADEDTSYSAIRKRVQLCLATEFLQRSDLTINEVANLANFSDAGAFRRAFQQWTGRSPSAYREDVLRA